MTPPMRAVILCGGRGTRAWPMTAEVPKPLLRVGRWPLLRHVMEIYARQGHADFVLAAGYRAEAVEAFAATLPDCWRVRVVDTGDATGTAGRITGCLNLVGESFFVTYGDGVGNVDLAGLLASHRRSGGAATMTTVPLRSQFGTVRFDADQRVVRFDEKPELPDHFINAGFFVLEREAVARWKGDDLEREVLPALAEAGTLFVWSHRGFWRSLDTQKDALELSALCAEGEPPWLRSPAVASS